MNTLFDIVTGFFIGLSVGGAAVLVYVGQKNKGYETYVRQLTTDYNQLQGQYNELLRQSKITPPQPKVTPQQLTPMMTYIGPENDGDALRTQAYERFGFPEQ